MVPLVIFDNRGIHQEENSWAATQDFPARIVSDANNKVNALLTANNITRYA